MTYVSFQLFSQEKFCKIAKSLSYHEKYSSTILNEKNDVSIGLVKKYWNKNESITCPNFFSTLDITWFDLIIVHKKINHFIVCWIKAKNLIWEFLRCLGWFNVKNFDCHFLSIKRAIVDQAKTSSSNFSLEVLSCSNNFSTRISFKCRPIIPMLYPTTCHVQGAYIST